MKYDGSLDANCKRADGQPRLGLIDELQKDSAAHSPSRDVGSWRESKVKNSTQAMVLSDRRDGSGVCSN